MANVKRFQELLEKANLSYSTIHYFLTSYEDVCYFKGTDVDYYIDSGRLWGMCEMIQMLDLLPNEDMKELKHLVIEA